MFFVVYKDGTRQTEIDLGNWNGVPKDRPLLEVGVDLLLMPISFKDQDKYCCLSIGTKPIGGQQQRIGYLLIGIKNDLCIEVRILTKGITVRSYGINELSIDKTVMRDG